MTLVDALAVHPPIVSPPKVATAAAAAAAAPAGTGTGKPPRRSTTPAICYHPYHPVLFRTREQPVHLVGLASFTTPRSCGHGLTPRPPPRRHEQKRG